MNALPATVALWLLAAVAAVSVLALVAQCRQRGRLQRWLDDPERGEMPEAGGAWGDIYSALQRLRKTERRAREALDATLQRFRKAAQALPDGVVMLDGDGRIEWLNPTAAVHFGLDATRDIGTLVEQLIRHGWFYEYLLHFRAGRAEEPLVTTINGEHPKRVLSIQFVPFADTGTLLLSRDVTEIARTETIRRDFIANVSHELRTPLTVISGFLEQLTEPEAAQRPPPQGFLTLMAEQAQRMNRLVADLLTLSRLENATEPPRDEGVDMPEMLRSLLAEGQALSNGRHALELGEVSPLWLRGSADELHSALGNLVSNAVRYTPAGGRIVLSWFSEMGQPTFAVADTGIGIPPEHIPRLTERFYRVDKGRSTASGGTGLGLAIVKHVLARHQALLTIDSEVGRGSTFAARFAHERKMFK